MGDRLVSAEVVVRNLEQAKPALLPDPVLPSKPYVEKSWHFDPATEPTGREAALNEGKPYQLLDATEKDKQKVGR